MTERVDLFDNTYSNFTEQVLAAIREETFGKDIGQNSVFRSFLPQFIVSQVRDDCRG